MLALRNSMLAAELDSLSTKIAQRLCGLPEVEEAKTISIYVHTGSEVRTMNILKWCLARGKRVIVPVTDRSNRRLIFSEVKNPEKELGPGTFGILEPKSEFLRPIPLEEAQVVLVPGVAWDRRGYRIGYGGGFYDRAINSLRRDPIKIGLSYEFQIVHRIPTTSYDRPVEKVATENRMLITNVSRISTRRS